MRCDECQTDPLTAGDYCECCGRKLSLQERKAAGLLHCDPPQPEVAAAPVGRCECCGAPSGDAPLCATCHNAFHPLLDSSTPAAPAPATDPPVSDPQAADFPGAPAAGDPLPATAPASSSPAEVPVVPQTEFPAAQDARDQTVRTPVEAPAVAAPLPEVRQVEAAKPEARTRPAAMAAIGVIVVAAMGFPIGKYWLGRQQLVVATTEEPPQAAASEPKPAERRSNPVRPPSTPSSRESRAAPLPAVHRASVDAPRAVPAKAQTRPARPTAVPVRETAAPAAVPTPAVPAPEAAPPPAPAPEPPPAEPAAPIGPLYETNQVNEAPKITARVEPQMPEELRERSMGDVVVVRVLVSQAGHPSTITLLRRSRAGRAMDDAVVAAVKRWQFSPAQKRGEAVSCWFNIGVPIGATE